MQGWSNLTEKYKELMQNYRNFALDIVQIKQDLQFYLALVPVVFIAASFFHFYYFKRNTQLVARLQGQKAALQKQLNFMMNLHEKHLLTKKQDHQALLKQHEQLIKKLNKLNQQNAHQQE